MCCCNQYLSSLALKKSQLFSCLVLVGTFLIYSLSSISSRTAAGFPFLSWFYLLWLALSMVLLGVYAVLWQQIIKRLPIGDAYMFKGLSIIFVLLLAYIFFGESITIFNIIGAIVIISGIALHANS